MATARAEISNRYTSCIDAHMICITLLPAVNNIHHNSLRTIYKQTTADRTLSTFDTLTTKFIQYYDRPLSLKDMNVQVYHFHSDIDGTVPQQ